MSQVVHIIFRLIFCSLDVLMCDIFIKSMFKKKRNIKQLTICYIVIILALFITNSFGITLLNLITVPFLLFVFNVYTFKISLKNGIVYTIVYYIAFGGGKEVAFEMLLRLIESLFSTSIAPWFAPAGIPFLVTEYFLSFLILLYVVRYTCKLAISENKVLSLYLLISPISSVMIWGCFLYMDFPEDRLLQILMCGGAFMLYFSNVAIFIIIGEISSLTNQIKNTELCLMKKEMETDHFQNISRVNQRYRQYMHDSNKYISSFRNLALIGNCQKIIDIIDERESDIQKNTAGKIHSSDIVLNSILSDRAILAKDEEIEMTIFVEPALNTEAISDCDKISLFGNLLDNALEAAGRCKQGERKVNVKLYMMNGRFLILYIENSYVSLDKRKGGGLLSTKSDTALHGLGIGIAKEIVRKYEGTLNLKEQKNCFTTFLSFPVCIRE